MKRNSLKNVTMVRRILCDYGDLVHVLKHANESKESVIKERENNKEKQTN